jgi:uncharacterized protein (TIGR03067 family)
MKTLVLIALGLFVGSDAKEDAKNDQKNLQGKWTMTSGVIDGNELPKAESLGELVFKDNRYSWKSGDGQSGAGTFKLDASKKPRYMDSVPDDGPVKGQKVEEIYELDGDNLKICMALPGTNRPAAFKSETGSGLWLFTYKRAK